MLEKTDIKSLSLPELEEALEEMGEKAFRAKQVYQWLHQKLATDFDEMTNLSKVFREQLKELFTLTALKAVDVKISKIDGTQKIRPPTAPQAEPWVLWLGLWPLFCS